MTTPEQRASLKAKAEAATPGPWIWNEVYDCVHSHANPDSLFPVCRMNNSRPVVENMHFIAAANPAVILELLVEIERLRSLIPPAELMEAAAHMLEDGTLPVYQINPKDLAKQLRAYAQKIREMTK